LNGTEKIEMMNIQMVDLKSQYLDIKEEIDQAIQRVIDNSSFINGPEVSEFSKALSEWNKSKFAITCANGTDGLQIAMMAAELKPGDEVIVPAFTYIATVEVIALLSLKPVFVDVDYNDFNIDVFKIRDSITKRTKAIVPVHLYGQCANMVEINTIAEKFGLTVIEDLAQAIGSEYNGIKAGNIGNIGVTSFFPSKNLGCYGDGGALFTNDEQVAGKIKMIANHGQSRKYFHDSIGVNSRLDTIQAALLIEKLKKLDNYIEKRQRAALIYDSELGSIETIEIPIKRSYSTHVYHQYTLKVKNNRDGLRNYLSEKKIPSMVYYPLPISKQEAYKSYTDMEFENANRLCTEVLSLPMHTHLSEDEQLYICETIKKFIYG
jgi:dTDP-4-amino-4,6-dideoxygalactose transaminase